MSTKRLEITRFTPNLERRHGPVSEHHEIWNKFSDLTKQMHDKREVYSKIKRGTELKFRKKR
jgi:hypothetical protein